MERSTIRWQLRGGTIPSSSGRCAKTSSYVLRVYNTGTKGITGTAIYSGGVVENLNYTKENDKWIETVSGTLPDGRKTEGKSTLTWDGTILRARGTGTVGGKPNDPRDDKWQRLHK